MKKRIAAVLLSFCMCTSTAVSGAAAEFDSQPLSGEEAQAIAAFDDVDIFSGGEEAPEPERPSDEIQIPVPDATVTPLPSEVPKDPVQEPTTAPENPAQEPATAPEDPEQEPTPGSGEEPGEDVSDVDIFSSGTQDEKNDSLGFTDASEEIIDGDEILASLSQTVMEVNQTDWQETEGGFKLLKDETNYYTLADRIVYIKTVKDKSASVSDTAAHDGYAGYYIFDEEGYLITGRALLQPQVTELAGEEEFFFMDEANAAYFAEYEGSAEPYKPWNSNLGQMQTKYWLWTGEAFRYYDSKGTFLSVARLKEITTAQNTYKGYYGINGNYYCLDQDGKPKTGHVTISDGTAPGKYYFQPAASDDEITGAMLRSKWLCEKLEKGERWRYYRKDGTYYERGIIATKLDTSVKGEDTYLLSGSGYILKSTIKKAANGAYYATDKYGRIYKNKLVRYNNVRYYFGSNGKRVPWKNCWHRCPGASKRYYYFGSTPGRVVEKTGWQKITNASGKMVGWFYFSEKGNHYLDSWSWGGYFKPNGVFSSGLTKIDGKYYFFDVSTESEHRGGLQKNKWVNYNNRTYYANEKGVLYQNCWRKIDGYYYFFQKNCSVKKNGFMKRGSTYGYLDSQGRFTTGWVIASNSSNKVRYINPKAPGYVKDTSMVIGGLRYYFDSNGYRRTDLTSIYKGPYFVEVDRVNGVMTVYDSTRTVPVKTMRVSVGLSWTPTPTGWYTLKRSSRWQPLMGPSWGQYGTHVENCGQGGIFVHSIACNSPNSYNLPSSAYNLLGSPASHGCIRVCVGDAKWVYDNCNGATIHIFDGAYKSDEVFKGPLGRNPLVPLRYPYNFDPTDPAV